MKNTLSKTGLIVGLTLAVSLSSASAVTLKPSTAALTSHNTLNRIHYIISLGFSRDFLKNKSRLRLRIPSSPPPNQGDQEVNLTTT